MTTPKVRMIAGPNGSGKSGLVDYLRNNSTFWWGHYLNADEVEKQLAQTGQMNFAAWNLHVDEQNLRTFLTAHPLAHRLKVSSVQIVNNFLLAPPEAIGGYLSAVVCDFIRKKWLASKQSFTFETVMSGNDKIELLRMARSAGYRTYLYYVCTNSPEINRERVALRVAEGGHDVPANKIISRYYASLENLPKAVELSNRVYLFDNSGKGLKFTAEFADQKLVRVLEKPPEWLVKLKMIHQR